MKTKKLLLYIGLSLLLISSCSMFKRKSNHLVPIMMRNYYEVYMSESLAQSIDYNIYVGAIVLNGRGNGYLFMNYNEGDPIFFEYEYKKDTLMMSSQRWMNPAAFSTGDPQLDSFIIGFNIEIPTKMLKVGNKLKDISNNPDYKITYIRMERMKD